MKATAIGGRCGHGLTVAVVFRSVVPALSVQQAIVADYVTACSSILALPHILPCEIGAWQLAARHVAVVIKGSPAGRRRSASACLLQLSPQ